MNLTSIQAVMRVAHANAHCLDLVQEQVGDVFKTAIDGGINFFDTAEVSSTESSQLERT